MKQTPNYIKSLLLPTAQTTTGRRAWSIDLERVWIPFFTATNTMGDTAIPHDALGAPLRLAYAKDGSVKFGRNGRPTTRIAKDLSDSIRLVRENFTANLMNYAEGVATDRKDDYLKQVNMSVEAGQPIIAHDKDELDKAIKLQLEQAVREAEGAGKAEGEPDQTAEQVKTEKQGSGTGGETTEQVKEKELVNA